MATVVATVVVLVDALGGALQVLLARAEASGDCYGVAATLDGLHAIFKTLKDHREAVSQAFGKLWPLLQGGLGLHELLQVGVAVISVQVASLLCRIQPLAKSNDLLRVNAIALDDCGLLRDRRLELHFPPIF